MLFLDNLDVFYGDAQALWNVSLEVHKGEIVTLLGSNGAGKTTTLKTISGLLHPRKGEVRLGDIRLDQVEPSSIVRHGIAHVPEGRRLFPNMTVAENLIVGAYNTHAWPDRNKTIETIYEIFPVLSERKGQLAGTLSGGEQQMVAIGRGLMSDPSLLMLDEPSLGLAPKIVEMIFQILVNISKKGTTILLIEQNAQLALQIAHRAYVMETGRISLEGEASDLIQNEHVRKAYLGL
ncbi:MAG: ABC transporter ATP-binding protein [Deltaproteobacteria bacterium]|nr:ABC transporter ATP-binding protein [Deltaproteobacteria bacterium]MBW1962869.1 ABC transporter ATP-binding protein [Deltaproteobacteria bacterium]MBW1994999.1 ABC transporter ATP-binding protein [Deltaproteobacteria bacterium]MBW2153837.1 ABC transporter ATP-binding protein [Deltaproteobacteria bacterium]